MLHRVAPAAPDPILGLTEAYLADPHPDKINLAVGVFKDADGQTPVLAAVKEAERRLIEGETTKGYLPIGGAPAYGRAVRAMLLSTDDPRINDPRINDPRIDDGRAWTADTPGGTGALRVAGDYFKQNHPDATVWLSDPTWANHAGIFSAAGVATRTYAYLDDAGLALGLDAMLAAIRKMAAGDVVLLHGCCHNPTGVDPTAAQWEAIAAAIAAAGVLPLVDFAYQGFGDGLDADAAGLRAVASACEEWLVCSSYSKNFGLYRDRVGALTIATGSAAATSAVASQVKAVVRRSYSNPPAHGAQVVLTILSDPELRGQWEAELSAMRERIHGMRGAFAAGLDERGVSLGAKGNGFVTAQKGMFTMSGLSRPEVDALRERFSIYVVGSGRINVAGMTEQNLPVLCDAIAAVRAG